MKFQTQLLIDGFAACRRGLFTRRCPGVKPRSDYKERRGMLAVLALASVPEWGESFTRALFFAGVCLGHAGLCIFALNWIHGFALPYGLVRHIRHVGVLLIALTPLLVWQTYGFDVFDAAS